MIEVEIRNIKVKLGGTRSSLERLYEDLSFRHPNAYYIKKKIKYSWDGKVHPFSDKGFLPTGLVEKAIELLVSYGEEEFEVVDHREIPTFIGVPTHIHDLELRGYQIRALQAFGNNEILENPHPRGLFLMGMNAGKTLLMMGLHLSFEDARTLVLVNNSILFKQLKKDFIEVFGSDAGYVQGKTVKWGKVTVAMIQSLSAKAKDYKEELLSFNVLAVDEADSMLNKTTKHVMAYLSHVSVRAAFTGTAFLRNLAKDRLVNTEMESQFGKVIFEMSMGELEQKGFNTKTRIKLIKLPSLTSIKYGSYMDEWHSEVIDRKKTWKAIRKRIIYNYKTGKRHILVFVKFIEQAEVLFEYLERKLPWEINYIHHKKIGDSLERFKQGDLPILITTTFAKRGLNLPFTDCIINASSGDWYSSPLQILGRGVRKSEGKEELVFEDFLFESFYLGSHSKQRIKYYTKVGLTNHKTIQLK